MAERPPGGETPSSRRRILLAGVTLFFLGRWYGTKAIEWTEGQMGELPAIYREPVILRDLRGLSTEEASRRLKVKDQTLKSRLHRGRLILRERLAVFHHHAGERLR